MARQEKKAESDGSLSALDPEAAATAATQARKREAKRDDKVGAGGIGQPESRRPHLRTRHQDIDWLRTIRANLRR
jgi:hypothetical protein